MVTWICEECGYEYELEEPNVPSEPCANCGADADRSKPKPPPIQQVKPPH